MPRHSDDNRRVRDERRERILHHARKLFAAKGLVATRITDIAATAGMSQGLMYHYFRSKEDIFTELIRDAFEKMNGAARELEAMAISPERKIRVAVAQLLQNVQESQDFADTVLLIAQAGVSDATPEPARAIIREQSRVPYDVVAGVLRAGQLDGSVVMGDPDGMAMVFWSAVKGLAMLKAVSGTAYRSPDPEILVRMILVDGKGNDHGQL